MRDSRSTLKAAPRSTGCGKIVAPPAPATSVSEMKEMGMPRRDCAIMAACSSFWHS
jgi:hypothetical protein